MATFRQFEDIESWQKARLLVRRTYEVTGDGDFARDFGLRDQIRRASVSIMSNIAEGFERDSCREFTRFLFIAKASAGEVRSQLYVALDVGYLDKATFERLKTICEEVARLISGLIRYLRSSDEKL